MRLSLSLLWLVCLAGCTSTKATLPAATPDLSDATFLLEELDQTARPPAPARPLRRAPQSVTIEERPLSEIELAASVLDALDALLDASHAADASAP